MAFSKTPTQDTYDTKRFPLVGMPQQRSGNVSSKDQRFLNCYTEQILSRVTDAKKYYLKKRDGMKRVNSPTAGVARGCVYEDTTNQMFFVVGSTLYAYNGVSLTSLSTSIPGSPALVGFTVHLTTSVSVVLLTGGAGYVINPVANTVAQITNANFPVPHLPYPVSMDGYLFVAKANTADVYNSNLDDPLTWTSGNFITAEMYPDNIVCLTKNNNYVVVVGSGSVEFFYDIGNATGSPLQRNDSAVQQFGTPAPDTVVQTEKEIMLVGTTQNGGRSVWVIDGFKPEEVSTEAVVMSLNDEAENLNKANAYCIRVSGHKFYVLRLFSSGRTWVYDFESKLWHEWSSTDGSGNQVVFIGLVACDSNKGFPYLLGNEANAGVYLLDDQTYQDDSRSIKTQMTTLKLDFDNMNRKDMYRASVYGDWPLNTTSTLTLEWSDNDYRNWSNPRSIQLSSDLPCTRRLGKFRRRAFRLTHTDNTPLRLEGMEVDINNGAS